MDEKMKGKAESLPTNHVKWINGFKSNMPDWPTARQCAVADRMTYLLRETRSLFFAIERGDGEAFAQMKSDPRWSQLFNSIQELVDFADLGVEPPVHNHQYTAYQVTPPVLTTTDYPIAEKKSFPKPPGVV